MEPHYLDTWNFICSHSMVNVGPMPNFDPLGPPVQGPEMPVLKNCSKFIITSLFLGVLTWDRHHLKGIFQGYKNDVLQNFAMSSSKGSKLRSKVTKISKFRFYRKWLPNTPKSPKIKIKYFMWIHPFFQKNSWWIWINHISMESVGWVLPKSATRAVRGGATPRRCFAWTTHTLACKLNKKYV